MRARLLQRRADECYMRAQIEEPIDAQTGALDAHREAADERGAGDALRSLARLLFFVGRVAEGERVAVEAVELLEQLEPGHELAMAYATVSQRRMVVGDVDAAVSWGDRARTLAARLDDTEAEIYALTNIGAAEMMTEASSARPALERALALAQQHGLEDYVGRAYNSLVMTPVRYRRFQQVEDRIEEGLEYCTEHGLDTWRSYLQACRARMQLDTGRPSVVIAQPRGTGALLGSRRIGARESAGRRGGPGCRDHRWGAGRRSRGSIALAGRRASLLALAGRPARRATTAPCRGAIPLLDRR